MPSGAYGSLRSAISPPSIGTLAISRRPGSGGWRKVKTTRDPSGLIRKGWGPNDTASENDVSGTTGPPSTGALNRRGLPWGNAIRTTRRPSGLKAHPRPETNPTSAGSPLILTSTGSAALAPGPARAAQASAAAAIGMSRMASILPRHATPERIDARLG